MKVLVVEAQRSAAERLVGALQRGRPQVFWKRAETADEVRVYLEGEPWDVVVSAPELPRINALTVLDMLRDLGAPPLIVVTDPLPVYRAAALMRAGAADLVDKEDLSGLVAAVERAIARAAPHVAAGSERSRRGLHRALVSAVLETADALVVVVDGEGRIVEFNKACERTSGFGFDEVAGRPFWECLLPDVEVDKARESFRVKLRDGVRRQFESRWRTKDGSIRTIRWSNSGIHDEAEASYSLGIGIDVTDLRRAERALRESEQKLRAVADNLPAAIYFKDAEGSYVVVNKRYEQWYGVEDGAYGKTVYDIFPKEQADIFAAQDREVLENGKEIQREDVLRLADGEEHCFWVSKFPIFGSDGALDGIGGIEIDVTERRKVEAALRDSEARIRAITDSFSSQISYVDKDQRYRFNNKAYEEWFGLAREDCCGKHVKEVIGEENYRKVSPHIERALSGERVHYEYLSRSGERERYADVTYIPDFGAAGSVKGFYALVNDITERRRIEQSLRTLHTISASQELSLNAKLAALLATGCEQLNLPIGIVSRIEGERYEVVEATTPDASIKAGDVFDLVNTYCRETIKARDVIGFERVANTAWERHPCYREMKLEAYLGAPVVVGGRVYGTLNFSSFRPRDTQFTASDREILRLMAQWIGSDIARKQTEESLRDREKKIRDITDALPSQIAYVDKHQIYRFNNKAYEEWYGISAEDCYGRHVKEILGDNYDRARPYIERALKGERVRFEHVGHYSDGDRYAEVSYIPDFGEDGNVQGFYGVVHDVTERRQAEAALRESETNFRIITETIRDVFWMSTPGIEKFIYVSPAYEEIWGRNSESLYRSPLSFLDAVHPDDRGRLSNAVEAHRRGHWDYEYRIVRPDGAVRWIHDRGFPVRGDDGTLVRMVGAATDITERKLAEENLRKLSQAVQQSPVSVVITDTRGDIEYVNPRFVEVTGYGADEVIGKNPRLLKSGFMSDEAYKDMWETIVRGNEWRGELLNRKKNGERFWEFASISPIKASDGAITHFVAVKEDITQRKEYEERLLHQASYDNLTALPNRLLTLDRVDQAIARAKREKHSVALAFIDLDDFKAINDTLGHSAGDALLVEAAHRLTASVRAGDTVGRLGGDEFVVVLPDLSDGNQSQVVADKILAAFRKPFVLDGREISTTASIGVSVYPSDGDTSQVLLRNADAAMYQAKAAGRNTFRFFTPQVNKQAVKRTDVEYHLRHALDRGELFLVYHPLFELRANRLVGAEALLRWQHPELGLVAPEYFVPVAENSGLIGRLGEFVVRTACRESKTWQRMAGAPLRVAVNVSSRQFRDAKLVDMVASALRDNELTPQQLEIEITESVLVDDAPQTIATLRTLSEMGIRFSVDDFGTGYSSISYLKRFPVNTLKIDRSFVRDITTNPSDAALAIAMIGMAHSLGLEVVAEGVETEEQLAFLRFHGCNLAQGYLFTRPMTPEAFAEFIVGHVTDRHPVRPSQVGR